MMIRVGDVRERSDRPEAPIRIVMFDELEALYDVWWPTLGWGFGNRISSGGYYRLPTQHAEAMPRLRIEPLSERESQLHRPDLPLRAYRHRTLNWAQLACASPDEVIATAAAYGADFSALPDLATGEISLEWISWGGVGPSQHVEASARHAARLTGAEVLWHAQKLFATLGVEAGDGIGLFRCGFRRGMPVYYIGGYHDFAGTTWRHEQGPGCGPLPQWKLQKKKITGGYRMRLEAAKSYFPFESWVEKSEHGLDQYTEENCTAAAEIFHALVSELVSLGESASEPKKLEVFRRCVEALNDLNDRAGLIESGERDELCELCNVIAEAAGLDPAKFAGGEGPASLWRDW